jgi:hypothetical protein
MKTGARSLIAFGVVAVAAIATHSYRTRSASDAESAATPPEGPANEGTIADPSRGAAAASSSRDTATDTATTRAAAARAPDAAPTVGLVSEQSSSPFVREVVRNFGDSGIPAGPLHDRLEQFAAEPADPSSATTLEASLLSAISQSATAVVDRRVECRAATCSMLLVYPLGTDPSEVRGEVESLAPSLGMPRGQTTTIFWPRADGAPSALVFYHLLRESTPQSEVARAASR